LYAFWGDAVAAWLDRRVRAEKHGVIVNLASIEYFKVADRRCLRTPVVHCRFEEATDDGWKVISFFAKRARGALARWAIEQRLARPQDLQAFDRDGYVFDAAVSQPDSLVFRRGAG
jgi:cytoplasmic iron level regulating protein YaaA (DUF328/UPF0246 family)